mmetsp:Transcript_48069/g.113450  ORF Transcript_48069/g.113450 Transcript_48069/m.113450 type:complete len:270 (+) Transcript_48069:259-1068(+)
MPGITSTIVVPAYKEQPNVRPLTERLFKALAEHGMDKTTELLYVDDNSKDGTVEKVEELAKEGYNVRIIVRTEERGLSSAVMKGFDEGKGTALVCMDGDLQHPPEKAPLLLKELHAGAEFVLGTRYGEGFAVDKDWPFYRVVISKGARLLARPLTPLSDPMSGFFGISRPALKRGRSSVSPVGFKIGLELYVKCGCTTNAEVQIFFAKREHGESKLTGKVMLYYLLHLAELYRYQFPLLIPVLVVLLAVILYFLFSLCLAPPATKTKGS